MSQPNNIDELFRQRLQQAEVPPPDFVWSNVERAIQPRKRRYFLWLFATVLAGGGLWALWLAYNTSGIERQNIAREATEQAFSAPEEPLAATQPSKQHSTGQPSAPKSQAEPVSEDFENLKNFRNSSPLDGTARQQSSAPESAVDKQRAPGQPVVSTSQTETTAADSRNSKNAQNFKSSETINQHSLSKQNTSENPGRPAGETYQPKPGTAHAVLTAIPQNYLVNLAAPTRKPDIKRLEIPPLKKKSPKKCYDFHTNRQAWLLDAYAGPSFLKKRLETNNPEYKSYAQDRLKSETHQWAFNAGVRASYLFAENFLVRTGLHYDQFVEEFEFIDPKYIKYTVVITQQYVNGQWVSVPDTVDIQYGANYVKTYNRFSLLDIPLQAALELRSGPMGISLNLGGSVNVLFQKRGDLLSLDGKPVDLEQYEVFRPKVGLSLLGSIQWFYHIHPRTRVFAEPYYRHILEPVTRAGYPVEQTYGISGIRLGMTQIFD